MLYSQVYEAIRNLLRETRMNAGLTQVELACKLDRGQSYVSKVERGEQYIDLAEFVEWCKACNKAPSEAIKKLDPYAKPA
ncbi:helix-turn-helix domain-containing protein [Pseudomonas sp. S 311-6]|uniref:helix-turn-helix domain-containing protein n=1 Tax=Alcaligenes faecalis TaxID=511 RepID=UPI00052E4015|nr:helix-turn-helix transcriptional regulator [Alcaligenes faecalis]KGP03322.1 DNA-binding protein [Alcaligenes faecalis]KVX03795.1 DNA-binding protein [Alcaligenes faecalis]MCO7643296.1 helix-turn-helix domain-containing protein [Pseudomonas sp. S 311-6]